MPATPATWRNEVRANIATDGAQTQPDVLQLRNGNILVAWTSSGATPPADSVGLDLIGRIFDPLGNAVTAELRLSGSFFADDEQDIDLVALPGGGFMVVFEDNEEASFNSGRDIRLVEYDANGVSVSSNGNVFNDTSNDNPDGEHPRIAVGSATSSVIVWREITAAAGESNIVARTYDPTTNTYGAQTTLVTGSENLAPDIAALSNGNYAVVSQRGLSGDNSIVVRVITPTLGAVLGATFISGTSSDGDSDTAPSVTALTGGGFVVTWVDTDGNTELLGQVFTAAGAETGPRIAIGNAANATENNNEPVVVPLNDGGFIIIYDDDELLQLRGQRFDASGNSVGADFSFTSGSVSAPSATLLGDGRVAVTFTDSAGEIGLEILDVRDPLSPAAVYTPNTWQVGTIGADNITGVASIVHGWDGNDVIVDGSGSNDLFGDDGDDDININGVATAGSESVDGGIGTDTLRATAMFAGTVYDLLAGTATSGGNVQSATNFENVFGDTVAETMYGTNGNNSLVGNGGDDVLVGFGGADTLDGGGGTDHLTGGNGDDTYSVDTQTDTIVEGAGAGFDTVQTYSDRQIFESIERIDILGAATTVVTGVESTQIYGNALNNVVLAGDGADTVFGNDGQDSLYGDGGNDTITGGNNPDFLIGGEGNDSLDGGNDADYLQGDGGIDVLTGGGAGDFLYGNAGADVLNGQAGPDSLNGGADADQLLGDAGNDGLYGEGGGDFMDGGADADSMFGGDDNDTMNGGGGADLLSGDGGNDLIDGGAENDTIYAESGNDTVTGGDGGDGVYGQDGADLLSGQGGNDLISGGVGADEIRGGLGADSLFGGADGDQFIFDLASESPAAGGFDVIEDFQTGVDKLDLRPLRLSASSVMTTAVFGSDTYVYVDSTNDGVQDFVVVVRNTTLQASDIRFALGSAPEQPEAAPEWAIGGDDASVTWWGARAGGSAWDW